MAEKLSDKTVADTKSNSVRWGYISLALVLAAIAFLIVPAESSNSTGQVIAGLSYTGRAVVAIAILMATLWVIRGSSSRRYGADAFGLVPVVHRWRYLYLSRATRTT